MEKIVEQHRISFKNAFTGLKWALTTQPNFRIHLSLSILVILIGWYVQLTPIEWVMIAFTIILGLSAEMINTSIEAMCDAIITVWRKEIKVAKDVAAGMMLTVAFGSIIVAGLILLPKLYIRLFT